MSSIKQALTKLFLTQANLDTDDETVKKKLFEWWKNPRDKTEGGFALTSAGFLFLTEQLNLKYYNIPFSKDFEFTTQIILFLDQYLDCPHYYNKKEIFVFKEKKAAELMLFAGDIRKYGTAVAMARQRELNSK